MDASVCVWSCASSASCAAGSKEGSQCRSFRLWGGGLPLIQPRVHLQTKDCNTGGSREAWAFSSFSALAACARCANKDGLQNASDARRLQNTPTLSEAAYILLLARCPSDFTAGFAQETRGQDLGLDLARLCDLDCQSFGFHHDDNSSTDPSKERQHKQHALLGHS